MRSRRASRELTCASARTSGDLERERETDISTTSPVFECDVFLSKPNGSITGGGSGLLAFFAENFDMGAMVMPPSADFFFVLFNGGDGSFVTPDVLRFFAREAAWAFGEGSALFSLLSSVSTMRKEENQNDRILRQDSNLIATVLAQAVQPALVDTGNVSIGTVGGRSMLVRWSRQHHQAAMIGHTWRRSLATHDRPHMAS